MRWIGRSLGIAAVCFVLMTQSAWGWNSVGHMTVAYVAYQKLTPQQKARVAVLLQMNPSYPKWLSAAPAGLPDAERDQYVFMIAATWPDQIKFKGSGYMSDGNTAPATPEASANTGYTDLVMHKYWHFVDEPFAATAGLALPPIPEPNAETEIKLMRAAIATSESDALKSYDLVWLEHLVGDIHQPLHCSTRITTALPAGDLGGNLVALNGNPNELHAYWDDLLGMSGQNDYATALTAAQAMTAADTTAAADLAEADWVQESFELAKKSVYKYPPIGKAGGPYTISETSRYSKRSLAIAQQRVELAGERLAGLLNAELK